MQLEHQFHSGTLRSIIQANEHSKSLILNPL